jgi:cell division inhibitor SulA
LTHPEKAAWRVKELTTIGTDVRNLEVQVLGFRLGAGSCVLGWVHELTRGIAAMTFEAACQSTRAASTYGFSWRECITDGTLRRCTASTASMAPWMPAAPSVCP